MPIRSLIIALLCLITPLLQAQTITIAIGDYPPFTSDRLKGYGITGILVKEALASQGVTVKYHYTSWKRAYNLSRIGAVAGTAPWGYSTEKTETHYFSDLILKSPVVLFYLKDRQFDWSDYASLKGKKIAAIRGFTYTKEFHQHGNSGLYSIAYVNRLTQSFQLALAERVDLVIANFDVGYFTLYKKLPFAQNLFTNHPQPVINSKHFLLFSKNYPGAEELTEKFNRGLKKLQESGRVDELRTQFRIQDMSQPNPLPSFPVNDKTGSSTQASDQS
ncbi:substrate-binding periplasmic protein [Dongshaea marina]|uniref:substrate-binding periplasmic protein n=1 Tax=Dongshaea marina TaxID=2047966 RepID=UPI000D3E16AE|nr:transporter substrate-binding domain-containing protein [Dongshaea marina]